MNNLSKRAGKSTREMAEKRHKNRVWFVIITMGVVLLIWLVIYNSEALSIGGFGFLGLLIAARLIMDYSDAKTKINGQIGAIPQLVVWVDRYGG